MKGFLSIKDTAKIWGVSIHWVNQYILEGRILGCERFGRSWAMPADAKKPKKTADWHEKILIPSSQFFFEHKLVKTNERTPRKAEEA